MGYTPLYDTMLTGTLYGRWPHTGIWACLLSRATREGIIDEVPASLAAAIGVSEELLRQCIAEFMQPDPGSRTKAYEGRRLELLDPNRDWGWKVLNHSKYREKARKRNFDDERVESGENAERMRARRTTRDDPTGPANPSEASGKPKIVRGVEASASNVASRNSLKDIDPTGPAKTREDPLSDAEEDKSKRSPTTKRLARIEREIPEDFHLTADLEAKATALGVANPAKEFTKFREYYQAKGTKWKDWSLVWQRWCREVKPEPGSRKNGADPYANAI